MCHPLPSEFHDGECHTAYFIGLQPTPANHPLLAMMQASMVGPPPDATFDLRQAVSEFKYKVSTCAPGPGRPFSLVLSVLGDLWFRCRDCGVACCVEYGSAV